MDSFLMKGQNESLIEINKENNTVETIVPKLEFILKALHSIEKEIKSIEGELKGINRKFEILFKEASEIK